MKVREILVCKTSDGRLHESERKATEHQSNIVGELLDGFLPHDSRGNVTQSDRFNILTQQLEDPELKKKVNELYHHLNFADNEG